MQGSRYNSPIGEIRMLASERGLAAIYFPAQVESIESRLAPEGRHRGHGNVYLLQAEAYLACYFVGDMQYTPEIPLDRRGTPFQAEVWNALAEIPPGRRWSYRDLASRVGRPNSVRAVAGAVARNPLSILVPCHRVVGSDGSLTGYAGGLRLKQLLLEHEERHSAWPAAEAA